jgi:hypothetical protein
MKKSVFILILAALFRFVKHKIFCLTAKTRYFFSISHFHDFEDSLSLPYFVNYFFSWPSVSGKHFKRNCSKNNKKNGTSSLASRRKDVRSPKGVEQRFTSSSSDDSDNSDTPKTPEHFGEDFEKEEPTSRDRTPRASPQALHVKMECSMSSTNVVRSRNTRSRGTPSTALSPSSSKSSNAKTKSIVNKQNIEKVQHKKKEEPVTIEKERVSR